MTDPALLDAMPEAATPNSAPMETDEGRFEVVNGVRIEMPPMSYYATWIASRLAFELNRASEDGPIGVAVVETLFRLPLAEDMSRNRRPAVAFVSDQRWPADRPMDITANAWDVVPDLAVEVISPSDLVEEQREKVLEYFRAGVRLVWVVYPRLRLVDVFEVPDRIRVLSAADELDGGTVLPGFRLPVASLFGPSASGAPGR